MGWIFEVRVQSGDRVFSFGARRSREEAEELLVRARVCIARTYVGAHLPFDVLGGAALG